MSLDAPFKARRPFLILCLLIAFFRSDPLAGAEVQFPDAQWVTRPPESVGLSKAGVERFVASVQGDGCLVKDGYLVKSWGSPTAQGQWASAGKPVLSTLLMLAVAAERLAGVDTPVMLAQWDMQPADYRMTFRHLANMTSGYARKEPPDTAWAYNDVAISLYAQSLKRIWGRPFEDAIRLGLSELQFEDGPIFGTQDGLGVTASPRDMARIGWLWLNRGLWKENKLIPRKLFDDCVRPGVSAELSRSTGSDADYLGVGTYGGDSDQTPFGPGLYGFTFWFNEKVPLTTRRAWPSLPADTFQANGKWNAHTVTVIPSWNMVIALRMGRLGPFAPGVPDSDIDRKLSLLTPVDAR